MSLFFLDSIGAPFVARDSSGRVLPGATLTFYDSRTTQLATITASSNPVVADSGGEFEAIELPAAEYRVELHTAAGVLVWACDPYTCSCGEPSTLTFASPVGQAVDGNGVPYPGAYAYFDDSNTGDPADVYADAALTTPLPNPLTANAGGWFRPVYLDDDVTYDVTVYDADGNQILQAAPYECACTGRNVLVAVASTGGSQRAATSDDGGLTWTMRNTPATAGGGSAQGNWKGLAWSPTLQRVVAIGDLVGNAAPDRRDTMYSDDYGETWTMVQSGVTNASNQWVPMVWVPDGGGFFLAGTFSGSGLVASNQLRKSADGITWAAIDLTALTGYTGSVADIAYIPSLQRIVCYLALNGWAAYSDDFGSTWTLVAAGFPSLEGYAFQTGTLVWAPSIGRLVAVGGSISVFLPVNYWTSTDGTSWVAGGATTFGNNSQSRGGVYVPNVGGGVVAAINADRLTTYNGSTWSATVDPSAAFELGIDYDAANARTVVIGINGVFAYSSDLVNWTSVTMPVNQTWTKVKVCS